ncbi:MAG: acyl-CoA desaturase [Polyangiaceae bacterium]|nr:acyl-CoA desaturase [Polyangiaceae bacterium]
MLLHVAPIGIVWTGFGWREAALCAALYFVRMFFITAGYHRYFAHRSFRAGRVVQFLLAFGGGTAAQKGALWWAGHHRHHHRHSDDELDIHSPRRGFWWSHVGWIVCAKYDATPTAAIEDMARYPELRWLDRYHLVPPVLLGAACLLCFGWSGLFGGFFLSTVILYHGTFVINSLSHVFGRRRYATTDTSRNSLLLALVTLGEGWHNNHHYYQRSTSQGFFWWEIDITFYVLKVLSWVGLVRGLHTPPKRVLDANRLAAGTEDPGLSASGVVLASRAAVAPEAGG